MAKELTVIVTCTDRKSLPVADDLRVRSLPADSMEQRARTWQSRLTKPWPQRTLRELYQGETWTQVLRLESEARTVGYEPRLLVASAGLGLRRVEDSAPAYGATFSPGSPDRVGTTLDQTQEWWRSLQGLQGYTPPVLEGATLWVLSRTYADVMAGALGEKSANPPTLVFGGSDLIDPTIRVPSNRSLRRALGGTATSLNVRMAIQWLRLAATTGLTSTETHSRWQTWCDSASSPDNYDRAPLSDEAIAAFIHALRRSDHRVTKTRALRQLRDAGHACEQRRFGALFNNAGVGP